MSPVKVMYAIDSLHGGGAETSLIELLEPLRTRGVDVSIMTLLEDDDALRERVEASGASVRRVRARSPLGWVRAIRRELKSARPDVVHTSLMRSDLVARLAALGVDVPVVTSLVNCNYGPEHLDNGKYGRLPVRLMHGVDILGSRRTTLFHAISNEVRDTMTRRLHVSSDRAELVYRGRDPIRLGRRTEERRRAVRQALGLAPDTPTVLVAGRLDKQKAVDVSIRAFRSARENFPNAELLVAGRDGNAATEVRRLASATPGVRMLGHRTDVPDLMTAADCLVFPSRWEGLGGTLIEALALELPVVASDIGPIREVLGDVDWPLVPCDDADALGSAMSGLLRGGESVSRRTIAGRQRYEEQFTTDAAADGMVKLYARAIKEWAR